MALRIQIPDGDLRIIVKAPAPQAKAPVSIRTGETNGHTHTASVDDRTGNGRTSRNAGHAHRVAGFRVQPGGSDNHRHSLRRPQRRGVAKSYISLLPVAKADEDRQIVLGVVLEPGTKKDGTVDDTQGSVISETEIERAAHLWLARFQNRGLQHKKIINSKVEIYESYLAPTNLRIGGQSIKKGTWLLMYHVKDSALWKQIKDGEIQGFSMGGFARKAPIKGKDKKKGKRKADATKQAPRKLDSR